MTVTQLENIHLNSDKVLKKTASIKYRGLSSKYQNRQCSNEVTAYCGMIRFLFYTL